MQEQIEAWLHSRNADKAMLVLLVMTGSFITGLLPIVYSSALTAAQRSQHPTVLGEAELWRVVEQR